jgi:hypothetical protein
MELRPASEKDFESLVNLFESSVLADDNSDKEKTLPEFREALKKGLASDRLTLALDKKTITGFLWSRLKKEPGGALVDEIVMMVIAIDQYGKGIGAALLKAEQEYACEKNASLLRMTRNKLFQK